MKKIINLLVILLLIISCTNKTPQPKEIDIKNISIDSLRNDGWHISKGRRLYYPQYEDSGYYYIAEYYEKPFLYLMHFHIINNDTFIYNGKWYPENLNLITNKNN